MAKTSSLKLNLETMPSRAKNQRPYPSVSIPKRPYGVSSHNIEVNNDLTVCLLRLIKIYLACIDEISAKKYNTSPADKNKWSIFCDCPYECEPDCK